MGGGGVSRVWVKGSGKRCVEAFACCTVGEARGRHRRVPGAKADVHRQRSRHVHAAKADDESYGKVEEGEISKSSNAKHYHYSCRTNTCL